ncbi:hypothetical protein Hanom_Chr06g00550071 [Helianthus anomalus]
MVIKGSQTARYPLINEKKSKAVECKFTKIRHRDLLQFSTIIFIIIIIITTTA